jgi:hypothetical protein
MCSISVGSQMGTEGSFRNVVENIHMLAGGLDWIIAVIF